MKIPANWTFERADIAADFDRHVREQLPWYDLATQAVAHIARHYIPRGGLVYDVGASTGNIGRALSATLADRGASLVSIEPAEEMAALYAGPQPENLVIADALDFDFAPADLIVLFLTAMFMPPSRRGMFFADLQRKLKPGGALVVVDKVRAVEGYPATVLWRLTLAGKMAASCDPAEIIAKELSLCGVQRPLSPAELPHHAVEFFRFGEFAGWIVEAA